MTRFFVIYFAVCAVLFAGNQSTVSLELTAQAYNELPCHSVIHVGTELNSKLTVADGFRLVVVRGEIDITWHAEENRFHIYGKDIYAKGPLTPQEGEQIKPLGEIDRRGFYRDYHQWQQFNREKDAANQTESITSLVFALPQTTEQFTFSYAGIETPLKISKAKQPISQPFKSLGQFSAELANSNFTKSFQWQTQERGVVRIFQTKPTHGRLIQLDLNITPQSVFRLSSHDFKLQTNDGFLIPLLGVGSKWQPDNLDWQWSTTTQKHRGEFQEISVPLFFNVSDQTKSVTLYWLTHEIGTYELPAKP
ncbi:hypothetical protein [Sulfuriroseicoccus oceanibius]|uniref:Uncharacterized protein n=1 Tax=Sulfuriroseicoccus oceanibius TaxID=2707525 RepID=A0A6B3LC71_9BACT|nr:hypothetical protein [Sulfuriroseicoccus oceanibius]QQL45257.1 hypothetical protein G3M56_001320 [Sulfuriroseicoccus oceanibius]